MGGSLNLGGKKRLETKKKTISKEGFHALFKNREIPLQLSRKRLVLRKGGFRKNSINGEIFQRKKKRREKVGHLHWKSRGPLLKNIREKG